MIKIIRVYKISNINHTMDIIAPDSPLMIPRQLAKAADL